MAKNISDIQFLGTNDDFVWRSGITDFETGSKLTVYESQEALFYLNGECVGVLGPGSHILETEHVPFLKRLYNKVTGNVNIFHAQVYFVNKVELDMKWGVGDIVYEDPAGPVFTIGCHGQMNLTADNSRKMVEKLVGNQERLTRDQLVERFRDLVAAEVQDKLVNIMLEEKVSITQVSAQQMKISNVLKPVLYDLFMGYGFSLEQFRIVRVMVPEDDPEYKRLKRLKADQGMMVSELTLEQQAALIRQQTEAEKIRLEAQAMAFKRQVEGYDYETEKRYEFLNTLASNEGGISSGISSEMLQMGAGLGMMGAVGNMMQNVTAPYMSGMAGMMQPGMSQPGAGQWAATQPGMPQPGMPQSGMSQPGAALQPAAGQEPPHQQADASQDSREAQAAPAAGEQEMKFCMSCGEKIPKAARFCMFCGEKQE